MYSNISYQTNSSGNDTGLSGVDIQRLTHPLWAHQLVGLFLICVGVVGFTENFLVLLTFYNAKHLLSPTNIFVLGLTIGDFAMVVFGNPLAVISALNGRWFAGDFMCTWEGFTVYFIGCAQVYLMMAIAIDRYIVIAKPLKATLITKRVAVLSVAGCFAGGLFWAVTPLIGWGSYGVESSGTFCGLDYLDSSKSYLIFIFIFVFLLPLAAVVYCYYKVYATVAGVNKTMVWDMNSRQARKNLKTERQILKTCIIMCVFFWVCWFPYAIVTFWEAFISVSPVPILINQLPAAAAKSEVVWLPTIFIGTHKHFRQAFYQTLPCTGLRDMLVKREADKEQSSNKSDILEKKEDQANNANPNAVAPAAEAELGPTKVEC